MPQPWEMTVLPSSATPADQLLGGGLDLLFHGLGAGVFLFDLLDALSPPHGGGTPERPGPVPYAADISDGRVVIS